MNDTDYLLMYEDTPVIVFNPVTRSCRILSPAALPKCISSTEHDYHMIERFCGSRILFTNRKYCKEILITARIDDQSPVSICLVSHALSFRDNYWIKEKDSGLLWKNINLYQNTFSEDLAYTALTGETRVIPIEDQSYTGELTGHGTKAKCFFRAQGQVFLAKQETSREISSEIVSYLLAVKMNLPATKYLSIKVFDRDCSVCAIGTSLQREMVPARDILMFYNENAMGLSTKTYGLFESIGGLNFLKMQVFDYLTLNTDRNRDNLALSKHRFSQPDSLFDAYDHDSCFKGKNTDALYFVSGCSFENTLTYLKTKKQPAFAEILPDIKNLYKYILFEGKDLFDQYGLSIFFDPFVARIENVLGEARQQSIVEDLCDVPKNDPQI